MSESGEHALLRAMRSGDEAAMRELYRRHAPRMLAFLRAFTRDDAVASDAAQQAWMAVLSQPEQQIGGIGDLGAWLVITARNAALASVRARARSMRRERAAGLNESRHAAPRSEIDELLLAVQSLDEAERELVLLKHVAGMTFDQMSIALAQPRSTVSSRYAVAIQKLRAALTPAQEVFHA